jgi:hypothetical protein
MPKRITPRQCIRCHEAYRPGNRVDRHGWCRFCWQALPSKHREWIREKRQRANQTHPAAGGRTHTREE